MILCFLLALLLINFRAVVSTKEVAADYFVGLDSAEKLEYLNWIDAKFGSLSRHAFLTSSSNDNKGAAVFWNIDGEDIEFAIVVRAFGWIAFGISEAGGMLGSDVVYFESSSPTKIVDSHIVDNRAVPVIDECQNWGLIASTIKDGWIILEVKRALDTGDSQDHVIRKDEELWMAPTRLIAAWGDESRLAYHGLNSARNSVRLFATDSDSIGSALQRSLDSNSDGSFDVIEDNYRIPAKDTTYQRVCKTMSDIQKETGTRKAALTLIGVIPVITEATRAFLHHLTVYIQPDCGFEFIDRSMIYVWGPGHEGMSLPDNVGFPLFERDNRQAISIEIHYNNPALLSGNMDSSGARFYYTEKERAEKAAILELGDPLVRLGGTRISKGLSKFEFSCPHTCSKLFLTGNTVTVLSEFLHMHQTGVRMTNEVIRGNKVIHNSHVDVFDFVQQGGFHVPQESFEIQPGDSFRTSCYYRDGKAFGLSSQDEMCIAYVMYYPAVSNFGFPWVCPFGIGTPICTQNLQSTDLENEGDLDRTFGSSEGVCPDTSPFPTQATTGPSNNPTFLPTVSPTKGRSSSPTIPKPIPTGNTNAPATPLPTVMSFQTPVDTQTAVPTVNLGNSPSQSPTSIPTKLSFLTSTQPSPTEIDGESIPTSPLSPTNSIDSGVEPARINIPLWMSLMCAILALG